MQPFLYPQHCCQTGKCCIWCSVGEQELSHCDPDGSLEFPQELDTSPLKHTGRPSGPNRPKFSSQQMSVATEIVAVRGHHGWQNAAPMDSSQGHPCSKDRELLFGSPTAGCEGGVVW